MAETLIGYLNQLYESPVILLADYLEITLTPQVIQLCMAP
ncbi:hypothetical protein ARAF_1589 [Arsenophonus endosymbiont of Aleurodicus floccissimus]|nr:hypothetical protein ARAF_1589 [Arsenophonus endosymbiont of Aleurodicus floccissimus]